MAKDNRGENADRSKNASKIVRRLSEHGQAMDEFALSLSNALHERELEKSRYGDTDSEYWSEEEAPDPDNESPEGSFLSASSHFAPITNPEIPPLADIRPSTQASASSGIGGTEDGSVASSNTTPMYSEMGSQASLTSSSGASNSFNKERFYNIFGEALKNHIQAGKTITITPASRKKAQELDNALLQLALDNSDAKAGLEQLRNEYLKQFSFKKQKISDFSILSAIIDSFNRQEIKDFTNQDWKDWPKTIKSKTLSSWAEYIVDYQLDLKPKAAGSSVSSPAKSAPLPPPQSTKPKLVISQTLQEESSTEEELNTPNQPRVIDFGSELQAHIGPMQSPQESPKKVAPPLLPKPKTHSLLKNTATPTQHPPYTPGRTEPRVDIESTTTTPNSEKKTSTTCSDT